MRQDYNADGSKKTNAEIIASFRYDAFVTSNDETEKAYHALRKLLRDTMYAHGFIGMDHEYWHFEYNDTTTGVSLPLSLRIDRDDQKSPGRKYNQYELQGVPLRIAVGPRDAANGTVEVFRRDTGTKESITVDQVASYASATLHMIQAALLQKNEAMRIANTLKVENYDDFKTALADGKFVLAHWDGIPETEEIIKTETKATIRCIPADAPEEAGICIRTGNPSTKRVLFAIAY